jgi:chromosomal replication initiator protein
MSVTSSAIIPNPWARILDALEKKINRHSYDTWLKPTRYSHISNGVLFVRVPTVEFRHVGDKYADLIQEAVDNLGLGYDDVKFVTAEDDPSNTPIRHNGGLSAFGSSSTQPATAPMQSRFDWDSAAQLNPRYTFDAFVIGSGNQFAHAACQAVAERPSKAYNPLFLYGGVGMGKTHLMQAIGHTVKKHNPALRLSYVSAEKFTNDVINSLRFDRMISFRDRYRSVDILLVDDIQFIAGKERTQEEFFHTFNALYDLQKQIVLSSDCPPKEISAIEERLRSRFEWGLIADIQPPDLETKIAILQKRADTERVHIPDDVAEFIARSIKSNVRELEGALTRLIAYASLTSVSINLATAQQVLRHIIATQEKKVTIELIQKRVGEQFGMRDQDLKVRSNSKAIAYPRQIAMYLVKQLTSASLPEIGRQFGGKHHTTVLHSVNKIDALRRTDKDLNRTINRLLDSFN